MCQNLVNWTVSESDVALKRQNGTRNQAGPAEFEPESHHVGALLQPRELLPGAQLLSCLQNEHGVAVAKKSIFLINRSLIGSLNQILSGQRTNEHEQR